MEQYREMLKIGSHELKEPLRISLTEKVDKGDSRFEASYILQGSFILDGNKMKGSGRTEEEALMELEEVLLMRYNLLRDKKYCLSGEGRAQLRHFNTMFK